MEPARGVLEDHILLLKGLPAHPHASRTERPARTAASGRSAQRRRSRHGIWRGASSRRRRRSGARLREWGGGGRARRGGRASPLTRSSLNPNDVFVGFMLICRGVVRCLMAFKSTVFLFLGASRTNAGICEPAGAVRGFSSPKSMSPLLTCDPPTYFLGLRFVVVLKQFLGWCFQQVIHKGKMFGHPEIEGRSTRCPFGFVAGAFNSDIVGFLCLP